MAYLEHSPSALGVSWMVSWEFRHSVALHGWLDFNNQPGGISIAEGEEMVRLFKQRLARKVFHLVPIVWEEVMQESESLTAKYTASHGLRSLDTLHLATAKHLGCDTFLTFDAVQAQVAREEHMVVPF